MLLNPNVDKWLTELEAAGRPIQKLASVLSGLVRGTKETFIHCEQSSLLLPKTLLREYEQ